MSVTDRNGKPVADVVVYATPRAAGPAKSAPRATAVMDQVSRQFKPRVLVVETGTLVEFPNSDAVSHHVYSFSAAKRFELPLYRGTAYAPVLFDKPGIVVLGCNIHDSMLGYIAVVDSPHFTFTDSKGRATLTGLAPGDYAVQVWTPRSREDLAPRQLRVATSDGAAPVVDFQFKAKLFPPFDPNQGSLTWSDY